MQDVAAKTRKRQFLPPLFVRAMLAGHSALGIAFAALFYVVCLTGTLAVFLHELNRWEQPNAPVITQPLSAEAANTLLQTTYAKALAAGAAHDVFIAGPSPIQSRVLANYHDHESGIEGDWIGDAAGNLVVEHHAPWAAFVGDLHMHLHLPRTWGLFLVGLTGVTLLSSLISGLLSHPRLFKDAFALRWGGSRRLEQADLHNRLGVWGLPFHVLVSTTGALLGLSTLIVGVLALAAYDGDSDKAFATILGPMASEDETAAPVPDISAMIRQVQAAHPNAEFVSANVGHIGHAGQIVHLGMRTPGHLAMSNAYYFDGNGKPLGDGGLETGTIGQQILGALQPLHFGWFGGFPVKIVYAVLGLALTVVTHSGIAIWLARRREQGRPAPLWEKVWAGVTWGQPFAIAAVAIVSFLAGEAHSVVAYAGITVLSILAAPLAPAASHVIRTLRAATGIAILSALALHANQWTGQATDPAYAWAAGAFAVVGLVVLLSALRARAA
jgi:uncharacterized iron-regulated membrane protein